MLKAIYLHPNADIDYFREHHIAMTKALPGLRKFTVSIAVSDPLDGSEPTYNLVNEVYFDDEESYKRAFQSPEVETALGDVPNFSDPARVLAVVAVEEDIPLDQ